MAKTCWKCCCRILTDPFTRADDTDIGGGWDEVEPGAAIASNRLRMTSAGCLVVTTAESSGNSYHVQVTAIPRSAGIHFRVICDYVDDDNYHFLDVHFRHTGSTSTIQLYRRASGSDTAIGDPNDFTHWAVDAEQILYLCLSDDGRLVGSVGNSASAIAFPSVSATTTAHAGTKIGLMLADAGTIDWDDLDWQTHKSERESCPACELSCNICTGASAGQELLLTIAGVANGSCSDCGNLNAAVVIPLRCNCIWEIEAPVTCSVSVNPVASGRCSGVAISEPYWSVLALDLGGGWLIVDLSYIAGTARFTWFFETFDWDGSCEWELDMGAEFLALGLCDFTVATVLLAVAA